MFSSHSLLWIKGWGWGGVPLTKQQVPFSFPWLMVRAQASLPYVPKPLWPLVLF